MEKFFWGQIRDSFCAERACWPNAIVFADSCEISRLESPQSQLWGPFSVWTPQQLLPILAHSVGGLIPSNGDNRLLRVTGGGIDFAAVRILNGQRGTAGAGAEFFVSGNSDFGLAHPEAPADGDLVGGALVLLALLVLGRFRAAHAEFARGDPDVGEAVLRVRARRAGGEGLGLVSGGGTGELDLELEGAGEDEDGAVDAEGTGGGAVGFFDEADEAEVLVDKGAAGVAGFDEDGVDFEPTGVEVANRRQATVAANWRILGMDRE